jgi:integrase/recombinase XerD
MAKLKLILDQRRAKNNEKFPLRFRVTHQTKSAEITTPYKASILEFDERRECFIDNYGFNAELADLRRTLEDRLKQIPHEQMQQMSAIHLRNILMKKAASEYTIACFWEEEIERLKQCKRAGGARNYSMSLAAVRKHVNLNIPFALFTARDLLQLESRLATAGMKVNSIGVHMRTFKAICNKAIKQELVDYAWYPFRSFTIRKEKTVPRVLTLQEMQRYFELNLSPTEHRYKFWCIGKLLFMLRGINVRDLINLTPANIKNGRIIYRRAKTGKMYSVALMLEAEQIFNQFSDGHTLLSLVSKQELQNEGRLVKIYHQRSKIINKHLKKLGLTIGASEEITSYVFRYTYANIAKQMGFSKDLIAEALGHEYGNKVTGIYLEQFDLKVLDEMNLAIYERVNEYVAPF